MPKRQETGVMPSAALGIIPGEGQPCWKYSTGPAQVCPLLQLRLLPFNQVALAVASSPSIEVSPRFASQLADPKR